MRTYVAEINGEALIAFRAEGDNDAYHIVNETNGDLQLGLNGLNGVVRVDGNRLWDGETEIKVRPVTDGEHKIWLDALDAETREDKQIGLGVNNMSFFYIVIGQKNGHLTSTCFDAPYGVYEGRAQAMYVNTDGKACSGILQFAYKEGKAYQRSK